MELAKAIIVGIIQGLTEFLPVSSSGHLVLSQVLLGIDQPGVTFEVLLHFGTALSVIVLFWRDIGYLIKGGLSLFWGGRKDKSFYTIDGIDYRKFALLLILATIPAAILGILFEEVFEYLFSSVRVVGVSLLITGTILWVSAKAYHYSKELDQITAMDALIIGLAQALALLPGISRSGMTIAGGLWRGIKREDVVRFSFLLSVPIILGGAFVNIWEMVALPNKYLTYYVAGTIAAFISGLVAIKLLLVLLRRGKIEYFAYYCWSVGLLSLLFLR